MMKMPEFEEILEISPSLIRLKVHLDSHPWSWLEACASGCGLHLRIKKDFKVHVFLGAVRDVDIFLREFAPMGAEVVAQCVATSSSSCLYRAYVREGGGETELLKGNFLMVMREYGDEFDEKQISRYFRSLLGCLRS